MTALRSLSIALCVAFAALQAGVANAEIRTQWIEYAHGETKLKGYLAYDDRITGKRPAVLMVHRRDGMTPFTLQTTEMYAKLGYVALAADIFGYGEGILPKNIPEMQAQSAIYNKDRPLMRARARAALDALIQSPMVDASKVALVGYCFGGTVAVELAYTGAPLVAMIFIHGTFRGHASEGAKNVKGKILILHGAEDKVAPLPEVNKIIEDLRAAKVDFRYELYSGAEHDFSIPQHKADERANVQSIASTARFLKETFGE